MARPVGLRSMREAYLPACQAILRLAAKCLRSMTTGSSGSAFRPRSSTRASALFLCRTNPGKQHYRIRSFQMACTGSLPVSATLRWASTRATPGAGGW